MAIARKQLKPIDNLPRDPRGRLLWNKPPSVIEQKIKDPATRYHLTNYFGQFREHRTLADAFPESVKYKVWEPVFGLFSNIARVNGETDEALHDKLIAFTRNERTKEATKAAQSVIAQMSEHLRPRSVGLPLDEKILKHHEELWRIIKRNL